MSLLPAVDWNDLRVVGLIAAIALVAFIRRWSVVLLLALLIALGQGLEYLLSHSSLGPEFTQGAVVGVYAFGGILLLFLAIAHFFTRD
jgi:hypothetical protein